MDHTAFEQDVFKEITRRTAAKITAAHQRGDDLRKYVEFVAKEMSDGANLGQAITTGTQVFPDLDFQKEITEILEHVQATQP